MMERVQQRELYVTQLPPVNTHEKKKKRCQSHSSKFHLSATRVAFQLFVTICALVNDLCMCREAFPVL